jgi:hypothetical protein
MGQSVVERWCGGSELVLAQWKGCVTRCDDVMTSVRGEVAPRRGKGGNDINWANANITGPKNK